MGKMPCFLTKSWDIYTHFSFSPKLKWPRFWSQMIPIFYIISYVYVSYEKREYKNNMEIFNQTRHFFICQSSFISFKSLTSLKTALKNYTWKVCVLPQQNAFGRPFSLKKHEEMFCDFAKTSGFFDESRYTKCISLGEMHIHDFSLNVLQADFSRQSSDLLTTREIEDWLKILHGLVQFRVLKSMLKHEGSEFVYGAVAHHKLESFWPCGGGKQGGGSNHHTPDDLALRSRGRRITKRLTPFRRPLKRSTMGRREKIDLYIQPFDGKFA